MIRVSKILAICGEVIGKIEIISDSELAQVFAEFQVVFRQIVLIHQTMHVGVRWKYYESECDSIALAVFSYLL